MSAKLSLDLNNNHNGIQFASCASNYRIVTIIYSSFNFFAHNTSTLLRFLTSIIICVYDWRQSKSTVSKSRDRRLLIVVECYLGILVLFVFGYLRRFLALFQQRKGLIDPRSHDGYVPLYHREEDFYEKHIYRLCADCFSRPICSKAGTTLDIMNRSSSDYNWTMTMAGTIQKVSLSCITCN